MIWDKTRIISDHETSEPDFSSELDEGIQIALKAEESGHSHELVNWLAKHPALAHELAQFLSDQNYVRSTTVKHSLDCEPGQQTAPNFSHDGFEILEEIGRGGMGLVYKAYDQKLKRTVAIKCIITGPMASQKDLSRFRFEAEAAAGLDHPAIVPVHSFGEIHGQPYLVMKYMEGGSLANYLQTLSTSGSLPPKEAARILRDIALGVHHAHNRGLLHRDLKPANILLDQAGVPHVADFGLALTMKSTICMSHSGSMAGTASYMAPEQVTADQGLTIAIDVHALGAILYELLTGVPPFGRAEWLITIQRVRDESAPSPQRLRPDLPNDLAAICLKCLEKRPEDRYPSALNLAEDLTRYLEGEPLTYRRRGVLTDVSRAVSHRRNTLSMQSWPGVFAAGKALIITQLIIQMIVLSNMSLWWAYAILGLYFVGWISIFWWFLVVKAQVLSPVERFSASLQIGIMMACFSLVPAHIMLHGSNMLAIYPPLTTVFGLGIFAHGATHWGRLYLVGLYLILFAAIMPLIPMTYWPISQAIFHGGALIWLGFQLRSFDIESRSNADGQRPSH